MSCVIFNDAGSWALGEDLPDALEIIQQGWEEEDIEECRYWARAYTCDTSELVVCLDGSVQYPASAISIPLGSWKGRL